MRGTVVVILLMVVSRILCANDTELNLYRPLTETTKHPFLTVLEQKSGKCLKQSQLLVREDAWRCVANGKTYDPCFVQRFGAHLNAICPESPWSSRGVHITVDSPLDNSQHNTLDMSRTLPWAIELTNGEKCKAVESGERYDALPVHYRCDKEAVLIGHVQRCSTTWKILQHNANGVTTVEIDKAWF